jgi:hypothetical protein
MLRTRCGMRRSIRSIAHDAWCTMQCGVSTGLWLAEAPGPVLALEKAAAAGTAQPAGLVAGSLPV